MKGNIIKMLLGSLLIMQTLFILINMVCLFNDGGVSMAHETNSGVLLFEIIANSGMMVFAMLVTGLYWREYVNELREKRKKQEVEK
jgi:hypothetical protein